MDRFARAVLVVAAGLVAGLADAEIFRWTDEQGHVHFTQDLSQVPTAHREAARAGSREQGPDRLQTFDNPAGRASTRADRATRGGTHRVPFRRYGTLMMVDVRLNDRVVAPFLADTGASGIAIPQALAEELGIRIGSDTPTVTVGTANGVVEEPLIRLDSVQLGDARVEGLYANVSSSMSFGLLGGTFFNNFIYQVDAAAGAITLVANEGVRAGLTEVQWRARFRSLREPLAAVETRLASGKDRRGGRIAELEVHRETLRTELRALEDEANRAGVPQTWR